MNSVLRLGTDIRDSQGFLTALKKANCYVNDWAQDIIGKPAFTPVGRETEVELVTISVQELGFRSVATRRDIYARAVNKFGFNLCPAEVGPRLRLEYTDQPNGEWLHIGMKPITDSDDDPRVFDMGLSPDGRRWLRTSDGKPGYVWRAGARWVFLRAGIFKRSGEKRSR